MTQAYQGSCLCGTIRFEADCFEEQVGHCHCTMCRKFHGAAFSTLGEVKQENFRWTAGKQFLKQYIADNQTIRQFCSECGSSLTFASPGHASAPVEISLACFDDPVPVTPNAHIFVANAANWCVRNDNLPEYEGWRDSKRIK
ncbi:MAG: GFA family protein [Pseudomonadota bacterium]